MRSAGAGFGAIGSLMVRNPRSYVAVACSGIDVDGQRHLTLKRAVLDLELLVLPAILGTLALTGDEERLRRGDHLHRARVDSGELDDDGEGGRVLGPVDVHLGPVAATHAR